MKFPSSISHMFKP